MLNTAEGGACFSCDPELHERLKRIRFFGFDTRKEVVEDGFNGKMTEVHAAIGLANLGLLSKALIDRKEKYDLYKAILSDNSCLEFQRINQECNYSYFPVIFPSEEMLLEVERKLSEERVFGRRYFYPSVNTYTEIVPYVEMPVSEDVSKRILCLPLYYDLSKEDIRRIAGIVLKAF